MSLHQDDAILEAYLVESTQMVEQLEEIILACENDNFFSEPMINEIFRIMHTLKGSSSMMQYNNIATLAHALEDLFSFLREQHLQLTDWSELSDLMLEGVDFTKVELHKIRNGAPVDGDSSSIIQGVQHFLASLADPDRSEAAGERPVNGYKAEIFFTEDCEMENVRAFQIVHQLQDVAEVYQHIPEQLLDDDTAGQTIRNQGFQLWIRTEKSYDDIHTLLNQTSYLRQLDIHIIGPDTLSNQADDEPEPFPEVQETDERPEADRKSSANSQLGKTINVSVSKLDELMDLVGELVIAEAMVTQHSDIAGLQLEQYQKAASQLHKITKDIQEKVMEIRMVPLATTFLKMHRVVRDMSKKLGKDVQLQLIGEQTEVDKNIIEHISDPIMHMVRNAVDHGLETGSERLAAGKPESGTLTLEAQNVGGEVLIMVRDDGRGLNKEKILQRAVANQVLQDNERELTDKEIYNMIFLPGFSTKENITEFSGRGVGMDVVMQNIAAVGGTVSVDSIPGEGSVITIKIPLTLAIIDGMTVRVGEMKYTLPTTSIKESFRPHAEQMITDPHGNEMIMVRGECYPIVRLHELYGVETDITVMTDGVLVMVEQDERRTCILVDELVGQQQVVVKALPPYLRALKKIDGISGCTLLGDGDISLILDIQGLLRLH